MASEERASADEHRHVLPGEKGNSLRSRRLFHRLGITETFAADPLLLLVTALCVVCSLVMVYSTTGVLSQKNFGDGLYYFKRQGVAALIGMVGLVIASHCSPELLKRLSPYCFFLGLGLLVLTLVPGLGQRAGGAQRWVHLGFVRFQPGEVVKLCFIIFVAGFFARRQERMSHFVEGVVKPLFLAALFALIFLRQPDLGSVVVIIVVTFGVGLAAGIRPLHLLWCGLLCVGALIPLVVLYPYRMNRFIGFLDPLADPQGVGYQLMQSLIAIGSGGFTGVGIGNSQQKLRFLPAAHTDFIYAVIGEEMGFIGCVIILALFLVFFYRGVRLAGAVAHDSFASFLALGLTLLIVVPALLNVGVVTGVLPTKGLVLPLLGYGGSSLVVSMVTVGLLLGVARFNSNSEQSTTTTTGGMAFSDKP